MKMSLIMATVGRCDQIHRFLDSLECQTMVNFELIIVDQNNAGFIDPIINRLSRSQINFRHVRTEQRGLSIARNIGLRYAQHEVVGYPDDDCWYEHDVVDRVLDAFKNDSEVDGVVGRWYEKDTAQEAHTLSSKRWRRFRFGISGFSSCLFFRRQMIETMHGFDESLGVPLWFGAAEEIDFTMRCLDHGARMIYRPEISIHHPVKSIFEGSFSEMVKRTRGRSRGTGALYRKHHLDWFVIARGLGAPLLKILAPPYTLRGSVANVVTVIGRCEGMLTWNDR